MSNYSMAHNLKLKLIIPSEVKPSLTKRFINGLSIEGCFFILAPLYLTYRLIKYIIGSLKSNQKVRTNTISFSNTTMVIINNDNTKEFNFTDITDFKFYFNSENFIANSDYQKYSKIEFIANKQKLKYYFEGNKSKFSKICDQLYSNKIKFKEFKNEARVFKGKSKSFQEIQKLKSKYDIEW